MSTYLGVACVQVHGFFLISLNFFCTFYRMKQIVPLFSWVIMLGEARNMSCKMLELQMLPSGCLSVSKYNLKNVWGFSEALS